jgi:hypothetical protein
MTTSFALTWDYRCPFARNAHEHVLSGLAAGADWDVTFLAFSLGQAHVEEGQPSVWDKPEQDGGILALQAGVIVRDHFPEQFPASTGRCSPPATDGSARHPLAIDRLEPDAESDQVTGHLVARAGRCWHGSSFRVLNEALDGAEALGQREDAGPRAELDGGEFSRRAR